MKKKINIENLSRELQTGSAFFPMDNINKENLQISTAPEKASKEERNIDINIETNQDLKQEIKEVINADSNQYNFKLSEKDLRDANIKEDFESTNIEIHKEINKAIETILYQNKVIFKSGFKKKRDIINKALLDYLKKELK